MQKINNYVVICMYKKTDTKKGRYYNGRIYIGYIYKANIALITKLKRKLLLYLYILFKKRFKAGLFEWEFQNIFPMLYEIIPLFCGTNAK
jgi:hypothetical protein